MNKILYTLFLVFILSSCYTSKRISIFSKNQVELGISKQEFINRYGKPYNLEITHSNNITNEKLLYKEELHIGNCFGRWFLVTTAFYFENSKLVKQEVVKEEQEFQDCKCDKTK